MADNYSVRDGSGNLIAFKSKDLGTAQIVQSVPSDVTGAAYSATNRLPNESKPAALTAKGYQQITSLSSLSALTVPTGATVALIQAESQSVRWRDDGTNPTTSVGMVLAAGESLFFTGDLSAFKAIEITASAKLNVSYYG